MIKYAVIAYYTIEGKEYELEGEFEHPVKLAVGDEVHHEFETTVKQVVWYLGTSRSHAFLRLDDEELTGPASKWKCLLEDGVFSHCSPELPE